MTETAIATRTTFTTLANYGPRDEVKELADRLKIMIPGGQKYTDSEALTLAQIAVAHDLDPFNGEVWLIKDSESGKVFGALIGLKGHRKHAKKQANYWGWGVDGGFTRITDPKKLEEYGVGANSIVFEYRIMDEVTLKAYTDNMSNLINGGIPLDLAQKIMGPAPVTLGVGIFSPGEKTKMKPHQCAMFRAEKDALKRRFDVRFRIEIEGQTTFAAIADADDEIDTDEIEAEYDQITDEPRDEAEILEELGFSSEVKPAQPANPLKAAAEAAPAGNGHGKITSTDFWKRAKELGVDKDTGTAIVRETGEDWEAALDVLNSKFTPPV